MFEREVSRPPVSGTGGAAHDTASDTALDTHTVQGWVTDLGRVGRDLSDAGRIDLIRALEQLTAAAAGAQAVLAADFDASQRQTQADAGLRARDIGKGIAHQIALARRESPHRGRTHLGLAKALTGEMPHTLTALTTGRLSEWRATLLVRETACSTREDRRAIDQILAADPETLATLSDRQLIAQARKLAYRLDPHALVDRHRRAATERTVTLRPAPDTMAYLTALVPVEQGVAAYAALTRHAETLRATGDDRTRGQAMADTLIERATGHTHAGDVGVEVRVVITDHTLLAGGPEPALLEGHGVVPAPWARDLIADATTGQRAWFRRLFTTPHTGQLIAMDSRARTAPPGLATLIRTRDQHCRTPWCDAPIRHLDHTRDFADAGPTTEDNLAGLCEACNHAKTAPGWHARPHPGPRHTTQTTTPTGHTYRSIAPPLPHHHPPQPQTPPPRIDLCFAALPLSLAS